MKIRKPAVAGRFYPGTKDALLAEVRACFEDEQYGVGHPPAIGNGERTVAAVVAPHAGYAYSGAAASRSYDAIFGEKKPDTVVILGTRHSMYVGVAAGTEGAWETPVGRVPIDEDVAAALVDASEHVVADDSAFFAEPHRSEHNIEVQLPFLQVYETDVAFVPVKMGTDSWATIAEVGTAVGRVAARFRETGKDVVVVASSDMTHKDIRRERDRETMAERDGAVRAAVEEFDAKKALLQAKKTTVCGPQTISAAMVASKELGATQAQVLTYYTSNEKTGTRGGYCVGYLSAVFRA